MIRKTIAHQLDAHLLSLQEGMRKYAAHAAPRRMHQLRVDMKYIRAVFFLLEDGSQAHRVRRMHRRVKRIFADAGRVREYQLDIAWFRLHRKTMLLRLLKRVPLLKGANTHFLKHIPGSLRVLRKLGQKARVLLKKTSEEDLFRYFRGLLQMVLSALQPAWPEGQWHDLRKHVKKLMIAGRWLADEKPTTVTLRIFLDDLDRLQRVIGNWHDLVLLDQAIRGVRASGDLHAIAQKESNQATRILAAEIKNHASEVRRILSVMRQRWVLGTP